MAETETRIEIRTNATGGTSKNWDGKTQTWRFVVHEDDEHHIGMHQHNKHFTLRLDTDQLVAIRDMLNNAFEVA